MAIKNARNKKPVSMTLDDETLAYIDAKKLSLIPGLTVSRSAVVRWLVAQMREFEGPTS